MHGTTDHQWKIDHITEEAPGVASLYLTPNADKPNFIAGQYVTVKIPGLGPAEGKAYSISNAPHEEHVRITVRKIGTFSSAILNLKTGDTLITSTPYGFFYPEPDEQTDLVFLTGGIGVTPCLSIIKHLAHTKDPRNIFLFYSNQTEADIVFKDEIDELKTQHPPLSVHHFITRERPSADGFQAGRMSPTQIIKALPDTTNTEFFLCGSMNFTKSLWQGLRSSNIPSHQLYTEGFF